MEQGFPWCSTGLHGQEEHWLLSRETLHGVMEGRWHKVFAFAPCFIKFRKKNLLRYMMLVDGENEVYFLDRDNCVFQVVKSVSKNLANKTRTLDAGCWSDACCPQVTGLTFLHRKDQHQHIRDTVLDGEMVSVFSPTTILGFVAIWFCSR